MNWIRRRLLVIAIFILLSPFGIWLAMELEHPAEIVSAPVPLPGGLKGFVSPGLVIQHVGEDGTVWSTRGYHVYKSADGHKFNFAFRAPSGNWKSWMANFRWVRDMTDINEVCDIFPLRSGTILAFSGGYVWRSADGGQVFQRVHALNHFGIGKGRGVLPQGMTEDDQGYFYYGEYFRNSERGPVLLYRSRDDGKNWEVAYRFNPGAIRHIHSIQFDPYARKLWITTGDEDQEAMIAYSLDQGRTFQKVGSGGQMWRAVSLLFTQRAVFWGTDAPHIQNWIYRWDRESQVLKQVCKVDGPIYYSTQLCDGTLIMARTVEGEKGEWDDMVSIWRSHDGEKWIKTSLAKRGSSGRYASARLARGKCAANLYFSKINTQTHEESLFVISGKDIAKPH